MKTILIVLCSAVGSVWVLAQQPPAFKSGVDLVEVDAVVEDNKGNLVRGLSQGDFAVREDGKPVTIESFAELDADGSATAADARFVVLLLDDWTAVYNTVNVQKIAKRFVERMGDRDSIAIIRVNGDAVTSPMSREKALAVVDGFRAQGPGLTTAVTRRRHTFEMIGALSQKMAPIAHRRKTLVFIGAPGYIAPAAPVEPASRLGVPVRSGSPTAMSDYGVEEWFGADVQASHSNVAVYVLDPAVLSPDPRQRVVYDRSASGFASETGGQIFVGPNVFDRAVDQIWGEAGHYYVIGYAAPPRTGKASRRIEVKVAKSGTKVHARRTRAE